MKTSTLIIRNLRYYWRTNLAVILGVATAVSVLSGALLVGDSVRGSLRDLFISQIGQTAFVLSSTQFFREKLAFDLRSHPQFGVHFKEVCPLISVEGFVTHQESGRRALGVQIFGVDDRFWRFHLQSAPENFPGQREVLISPALGQELCARSGDSLLVRIESPSDIPAEFLYGRRDKLSRTIRLTLRETLPAGRLGEFSIKPQQGTIRAAFVPLRRLQKDLEQDEKANILLFSMKSLDRLDKSALQQESSKSIQPLVQDTFALDDLGINLRFLENAQCLSLEGRSTLLTDDLTQKALNVSTQLGFQSMPIFTYLANSIRDGEREIPYSLVTALDSDTFAQLQRDAAGKKISVVDENSFSGMPPILLNDWAASDLKAHPGEVLTLEYYVWKEAGRLATETAQFQLKGVLAMKGIAADRALAPEYPGITQSESLSDWDPPFPMDLARIRPQDEKYWKDFRTTPKAFIPLEKAQQLWKSRFGSISSLRIFPSSSSSASLGSIQEKAGSGALLAPFQRQLRSMLSPAQMGFSIVHAREQGLQASKGATDFAAYFLYFSCFLVISAFLLTILFFRLGIEQRFREIGVLRTLGFPPEKIRQLFLSEGLALSAIGSIVGVAGALGYGGLMMLGLRTWWFDAVGTTRLTLHVSKISLVTGCLAGIVAALVCIVRTLRSAAPASPRSLLAGATYAMETGSGEAEIGRTGEREQQSSRFYPHLIRSLRTPIVGIFFGLAGLVLLLLAAMGTIGYVLGFFGAGSFLLIALLFFQSAWLRRRHPKILEKPGWWTVLRLGVRNMTSRPGRSVLCIALIASATFIIVSVDAFRRKEPIISSEKKSGSGGFPLLANSLLPLVHDPNTPEGRDALNLSTPNDPILSTARFINFRVRSGDDVSCLNLYQPQTPRILGAPQDFLNRSRFSFQESLAQTSEERESPWLLLNRQFSDGAIPIITDANSMTYVLHLKLGDDWVLNQSDGNPVRLRVVAALSDSVFQSEFVMSESNFLRLFPTLVGYRFFLLDVPSEQSQEVTGLLENRLADYGFDITPTADRLESFHRVENTYLSTFQTLGGLGLLLGTMGLATVLLRNVLEHRRELALLRAVGYTERHLALMIIGENILLLFCGLSSGLMCSLLAIAPALFSRGGQPFSFSLAGLLLTVFATGMVASILATVAAVRSPLLDALRAE